MAAEIALLRRRFPDARISVSSFNPALDERWIDAQTVRRGMPFLSLAEMRAIRRADLVLWGGGGLLIEQSCLTALPYWAAVILFIRRVLRRPVVAWAQGLDLRSDRGRRLAAKALGAATLVTVRDAYSLAQTEALGIRAKTVSEPVCILEPAEKERTICILREEGIPTDRPLIALCPSYWSFYNRPGDVLPYLAARRLGLRRGVSPEAREMDRALAAIADGLIDRLDGDIVLLPHYPDPLWRDLWHLGEIRDECRRSDRVHILRGDAYSPTEYLGLFRHFRLTVATPMHESMFALMTGTPCLQLSYEEKGRALFRSLGAEDCLLDWRALWRPDGVATILARAERVLSAWATLWPTVARRLDERRAAATASADLLDSAFPRREKAPHAP